MKKFFNTLITLILANITLMGQQHLHLQGHNPILTIESLTGNPRWQLTDNASSSVNGWVGLFDRNDMNLMKWRYNNITKMSLSQSSILDLAGIELRDNSTVAMPHLKITEIGQDFSRITFDNTAQPGKFWTIAGEPHSTGTPRMNFYYHDGSIGVDRLTVTGDGKGGNQSSRSTDRIACQWVYKIG